MIQYKNLYNLVVFEMSRYCMGYWDKPHDAQEDFDELLRDVTKFFSDDNKLSTKFTAVMVFMKNTEQARIPWHAKVYNLLKMLTAVLFSEEYAAFDSAGELAMAFQKYNDNFNREVAKELKNQLEFDDHDIAAVKANNPEIINRIMAGLVSKEPMYLNEVASYLIKL